MKQLQSTLPRRERHTAQCLSCAAAHFNPRSREGSDAVQPAVHVAVHGHFNPRSREGSDLGAQQDARPEQQFQSTLPRRERPAYRTSVTPTPKFQSTLPRRERRSARLNPRAADRYFNPRSREGSDPKRSAIAVSALISIHAPAKGATPWSFCRSPDNLYFNPRSREGSDRTPGV